MNKNKKLNNDKMSRQKPLYNIITRMFRVAESRLLQISSALITQTE